MERSCQFVVLVDKNMVVFITDRVRSTREGYVLTRICPSVCPQGGGYPTWPGGGVPQPGPAREYPTWTGGYSSQVQPRGYPNQVQMRVPQPGPGRGVSWPGPARGVPQPGPDGGTSGYPPGMGTPCQGVLPSRGAPWPGRYSPLPSTRQQMEYLIRRGRYASCVHAGGLS